MFLDARNDVLERRYRKRAVAIPSASRLRYPRDEAILQEREILAPLYEMADYKIDTSLFSTAQLKDRVVSLFSEPVLGRDGAHGDVLRLQIRPAQRGGYRI